MRDLEPIPTDVLKEIIVQMYRERRWTRSLWKAFKLSCAISEGNRELRNRGESKVEEVAR